MLGRRKILAVAALVTAGAVGCSGMSKDEWSDANPGSQGYRWVGQGEQGNFGAAYSFCRGTLANENEGQALQGGSGPITTVPGGPTTIPGYSRSAQSTRSDIGNRRQFSGCMESQGWALSEPTSPQPTPLQMPQL